MQLRHHRLFGHIFTVRCLACSAHGFFPVLKSPKIGSLNMYFKALDRESQMVSERRLALTIHICINFTNIYHAVELICFRLI